MMLRLFESWKKYLAEGSADFKVIWVVGPAGSGKSSLIRLMDLKSRGFEIINTDDEFERLLSVHKIGKDIANMSPEDKSKQARLSAKARQATDIKKKDLFSRGANLVIDKGSISMKRIAQEKAQLEKDGYQTFMVMAFVDLETSLQRNAQRGKQGGRRLPDKAVEKSWNIFNNNSEALRDLFGNNFYLVRTDGKELKTDIQRLKSQISGFMRGQ